MSQDVIPSALAEHTDKPIVEARFHLTEVASMTGWGDSGYKSTKVVRIRMQAAKSGLFGKASPNGSLEITIANPAAFKVFETAMDDAAQAFYDESVPSPKMGTKRFRIYIVEDEDQTPA